MPLGTRIRTIALMWCSIAVSCAVLIATGPTVPGVVVGLIVAAGVVGTFFIWRFRRQPLID